MSAFLCVVLLAQPVLQVVRGDLTGAGGASLLAPWASWQRVVLFQSLGLQMLPLSAELEVRVSNCKAPSKTTHQELPMSRARCTVADMTLSEAACQLIAPSTIAPSTIVTQERWQLAESCLSLAPHLMSQKLKLQLQHSKFTSLDATPDDHSKTLAPVAVQRPDSGAALSSASTDTERVWLKKHWANHTG
ncbi:hypothetical protein WJX77_007055 [Trebouxia sp. C0004]